MSELVRAQGADGAASNQAGEKLRAENRKRTRAILVIVGVALAIRIALIPFLVGDTLNPRRDHWPFGWETGRIARSIASGQGFSSPLFEPTGPTAWMTPVYPYLLAGIFKVFGLYTKASAWAILILNGIFSALTCVPIIFLARRSFGEAAAMRAGWLWAFFPYAVYVATDYVWETCLAALLLASLLWLTMHLERGASFRAWIAFGLMWGLAALTNPAVLSLLPFLAGWACYRLWRRGHPWSLQAATAAAVFLLTLVPWQLRNYQIFHRSIPLRDTFWLVVWEGNNGDTSNWSVDAADPSTNPSELAEFDRVGELPYIDHKKHQALAFITSHPGTFVVLSIRRFVYTWTGYWSFARDYLAEEPLDPANILFSVPLTVLMVLGLGRAVRRDRDGAVLYLLAILVFPVVYYITHPGLRYRHVIDPEIVVLVAYAITSPRRAESQATGFSPGERNLVSAPASD